VLLGPVAWFVVGRPRKNAPYGATRPDERRWVAPDDNPEFLKSLKDGSTSRTPSKDEELSEEREAESAADDARAAADREAEAAVEPDPARQDAELRRREEESRRRENGAGGDDTPPQGR
ncbi:MAG TPA: hypothetical protein VGO89_05365, partial [Streptomyces sp.]|nr:hypothetical protein [Streptomyces sp.]